MPARRPLCSHSPACFAPPPPFSGNARHNELTSSLANMAYYSADYAFNDFTLSAADLLPASSTPLLNVNETDFLNALLDNPPNLDDFNFPDAALQRNLFPPNFGWLLDEQAPTVQGVSGSAADAAHQFHPHHGLPAQQPPFTAAPSSHSHAHSLPASAGEDVLGAASALLHSPVGPQHAHQSSGLPISQQHTSHVIPSAVSAAYLPTTPVRTSSPTSSLRDRRQSAAPSSQLVFNLKPYDEDTDTILTPGLGATFDHDAHAGITTEHRFNHRKSLPAHFRAHSESYLSFPHVADAGLESNRRLYRFGSDAHFNVNGYVRGPEEPSEEQLTQRLLDDNFGAVAGGFLSAASTRPSSPAFGMRHLKRDADDADDDSDEHTSHKRRKSGRDDHRPAQSWRRRATSASGATFSSLHRRRKSSPPMTGAAASSGTATPAKKTARENLTEEQKRSNHIVSEQRRRNLIKVGFEDLNNIVPSLREGGLSKSQTLAEAAAYLENIVAGNAALQARLAAGSRLS